MSIALRFAEVLGRSKPPCKFYQSLSYSTGTGGTIACTPLLLRLHVKSHALLDSGIVSSPIYWVAHRLPSRTVLGLPRILYHDCSSNPSIPDREIPYQNPVNPPRNRSTGYRVPNTSENRRETPLARREEHPGLNGLGSITRSTFYWERKPARG